MRLLLEQVVRHEINRLQVKEKMTGHLVKRKRRGTYQALSESDSAEKNIEEIIKEMKKVFPTKKDFNKSYDEMHKKISNLKSFVDSYSKKADLYLQEIMLSRMEPTR